MSKYSQSIPPDIEGALSWLLAYVKPKTAFLDVGCSTGYFGGFVKDHKQIAVDGIEISKDAAQAAKRLDEVFSFDVDEPWPKLKKKYDYIHFGDVLEHLKVPSAALAEASKFLKKDGVIFVSIPNIAHISIRLELLRGSFCYEPIGILDNTHLQYFTKDTFINTAADAGFSAELVDYTENDIPKEIIEQYLKDAGLTATKKFWDMTRSVESRAYQFKFILRSSKLPAKVKAHKLDKPLRFRDDHLKDFQNQLDAIHSHADKQAKIIEHYVGENKELANKLEAQEKLIRKTLRYQVKKQVSRVKRSVKESR